MVIRRPPSPTKSATVAPKSGNQAISELASLIADGNDEERRDQRASEDTDDRSDVSGSVEDLAVEDCKLSSSHLISKQGEVLIQSDEISRLRRIRENEILLSELGISASLGRLASTSSLASAPPKQTIERQRRPRGPVYDRSGYIMSQPEPGQTFRMACVEMPSDRNRRKRISDGDYQDCSRWAEGEERRWRFGDGEGTYEKGEAPVVGGIGPDFRWRAWLGTERELRREMVQRGQLNEMDMVGAGVVAATNGGQASAYSVSSSCSGNVCLQDDR